MGKTIVFGLCIAVAGLPPVMPVYSSNLIVHGEAASNGLNVVIHTPDEFTNRVEIFACSDLISGDWRVAAENLRLVGGNPARWYTEVDDTGFFMAENMDIDSDGDGLSDAREKYVHKTDPLVSDSDRDRMPDRWEVQHALNPLSDADATADRDGDGMNNLEEYQTSPDLSSSDLDGDGFIDAYDRNPDAFDYPVGGESIFNMVASTWSIGYAYAFGFSLHGEQLLTLRWSDDFFFPPHPDHHNGGFCTAGSSSLEWVGKGLPDDGFFFYRFKDYYWWHLDLFWSSWKPSLHPSFHGLELYEYDRYFSDPDRGAADAVAEAMAEYVFNNPSFLSDIHAPTNGSGHVHLLGGSDDGSQRCVIFTVDPSKSATVCFLESSGKMKAVDYAVSTYDGYSPGTGLPSSQTARFKFIFNQPVTNKTIKWLTYNYDYDVACHVNFAIHRCEVNGIESELFGLNSSEMIVPTVDLNGDFDSDGDVDADDTILRASADASLRVVQSGRASETPGNGVVSVTVGSNVIEPIVPESVLRIKFSGVEPGELFRLWSTTNIIPEEPPAQGVIGGGGGRVERIADPPLLISTEEGFDYAWPVKNISPLMQGRDYICRYTYTPEFPKTLYLECVSCGATNDGRAKIELIYEYNGEEICSAALPITVIRSKLIPDWNHDRMIDADDQNQSTNNAPFRFWINDDNDNGDISEGNSDVPGQGGGWLDNANYKDGKVNGRSDLLDFFPVWLDIKLALNNYPVTNGAVYKLRQADEALRFVYTDLTRAHAGDYLVVSNSTCGVAFSQNACEADTVKIDSSGVTLNTNFLNRIVADPDKGVLMMEAIAPSTSPLILEIWQNDSKVWETSLALSFSGVEAMYRKVNLRNMENPGILTEPANNPDASSNGKNLVFLHGYQPDVGDSGDMSTWLAEMFKRFYQSGSKAMFHGILWYSNQGDPMDYQKNVTNAFQTAPVLKSYVDGLSGPVIAAAHSLGNMVVSSAIVDQNMTVSRYMMCDAAVASEAYDATMLQDDRLVNEWWADYSSRTWAANWYQLFSETGDSRESLTWKDRFADIGTSTETWNFYSTGDEVFALTPNQGLFAGTIGVDADWRFIIPVGVDVNVNFGRHSWQKQELFKGCRYSDGWTSFGGTSYAGWGFESDLQLTIWHGLPALVLVQTYTNAAGANMATDEQLRSYPVFEHDPDWLTSTGVLSLAQINEILCMGIPSLTPSIGKTQIKMSIIPAEKQFNLNSENANEVNFKPNSWPTRPRPDLQNWLHNDMKDVAYFYSYKLFDRIAYIGGIK